MGEFILSHALMRMTAPSAEGAKGESPLRRRGGGFPIAPATPSVRSPCKSVVT